jgi:hypothetical protein
LARAGNSARKIGNIGPVSQKWLDGVDVQTLDDVREIGVEKSIGF